MKNIISLRFKTDDERASIALQGMTGIAAFVFFAGCAADLRTQSVQKGGFSTTDIQKGNQLMAASYTAHGGDAARVIGQTQKMVYTDIWAGLSNQMFRPWPENGVLMQQVFSFENLNSEITFLEGDATGTVWGILDGKSYKKAPGSQLAFEDTKDITFYLPALQYLVSLPWRLPKDGTIKGFMGKQTVQEKEYETVLVTWGKDFSLNKKVDQYAVYLDPQTHQMEKVAYTIREFGKIFKGCIQYDEWATFGEFKRPKVASITFNCNDPSDDFIHRIHVSEWMQTEEKLNVSLGLAEMPPKF